MSPTLLVAAGVAYLAFVVLVAALIWADGERFL